MSDELDTLLVHAGARRVEGAVVTPVFQSANFLQDGAQTYSGVRYMRLSNSPQHEALAEKLAAIEESEQALVFTSGMAAISTALLSVLSAGDHLVVQQSMYGGTATLIADLARFDIRVTAVDPTAGDWAAAVRPETRAIYVESLSNPLLAVPDLQAVVDVARRHGLVSIIDNTFVSPVGFRPIPFGFDVVVHSATKYLNGHSDVVAGVVAGSQKLMDRVRHLQNHLGGSLDAHACFLLERGLKTLSLRVPRQAGTAGELARFLVQHPRVSSVRYPGLPHDPHHERAARWFSHFGGMLSFEVASDEIADQFVQRTRIALNAASLGGLETLMVRPSRSSHIGLPVHEREALGITDRLIRVSVGIEAVRDLRDDIAQALQ